MLSKGVNKFSCALLSMLMVISMVFCMPVTPAYASVTAATLIDGLDSPAGLVVDSHGNIIVSQTGTSNKISKFDSNGNLLLSIDATEGFAPTQLEIDSNDIIYAADYTNNAIFKCSSASFDSFVKLCDTSGAPLGLGMDSSDYLYYTSANTTTIKKHTPAGLWSSDIGTNLENAMDVAIDASVMKYNYVAESGKRYIKRIQPSNGAVELLGSGSFSDPRSIVYYRNGDRLFVADGTTLKRMERSGDNIVTIASGFSSPGEIAVDSGGNVYIADETAGCIKKITMTSTSKVIYNGNGNTSGSVPVDNWKYYFNTAVSVRENTGYLARTGYTFSCWNTSADGTGIDYLGGDTFMAGVADTILYAKWLANEYRVTYDGNGNTGGAVPSDRNTHKYGSTVTVLNNTENLVRKGYDFACWNTKTDGSGTAYAGGSTLIMGAANIKLYAQWTQGNFSVIYAGNGNTTGSVPVDAAKYHPNATVSVMDNIYNMENTPDVFVCWNTSSDGSGNTLFPGDTFKMGKENTTLYAQWGSADVYVTYAGNGSTTGSAPIDNTIYHPGDTVTVSGNIHNLDNGAYEFLCWNTRADGSGTSYMPGDTFRIKGENVTLYAKWLLRNLSVIYNGNGNNAGSVPRDSTIYHPGDTVTVLGNVNSLSKNNWLFIGWNTRADGSGIGYMPGDTLKLGVRNVILYAQWMGNDFHVTYSGNGNTKGNPPSDIQSYQQGDAVYVLDNTGKISRNGYVFIGWNTRADGSGVSYQPGDTFTIGTKNVTLYAKWQSRSTFKVTYSTNKGKGKAPKDVIKYHEGDLVTVMDATADFKRSGYLFSGWNTRANGSGFSYQPGDTFRIGTTRVTLYAQWTAVDYTITYDGNGNTDGTVPSDNSFHHVGDKVILALNSGMLVREGYTFIGWNTKSDGKGKKYKAGAKINFGTNNMTLYAMWKKNK